MRVHSTMRRSTLLREVKKAVLAVDQSAEVILYGSRARGDARPDSDWDLLILVDGPADEDARRKIRHAVYEIEWDTGQVLSCTVHTRNEWDSEPLNFTPFRERVSQEGVRI
jgi:predicted nucleotidyltransferase